MNEDNIIRLGNFIETFVKTDKIFTERKLRSYLRVQISVDTTRSLKSGAVIRNDDGSTQWINMKGCRISASSVVSWDTPYLSALILNHTHKETLEFLMATG